MKNLFLTTALLSALTVPAFAQTAEVPAEGMYLPGIDTGVRASAFIGKKVFVTDADTAGLSDTAIAAADESWQNAGEINDIIISLKGDTEAVLVDVGGFLGIGEKTVAVALDQLTLVPDSASPQDYFIVFHGTKESLTGAPAFDKDMVFEANATTMEGTADGAKADATAPTAVTTAPDATATATEGTADGTMATADATEPAAVAPMPEAVDLSAWSEIDLVGKRVYGPNQEDVGEISAVALTADGKVEGAVVDVGGFLGIGEKKVALGSDMLMMVKEADGTTWFQVNATQEQLESLNTYAG